MHCAKKKNDLKKNILYNPLSRKEEKPLLGFILILKLAVVFVHTTLEEIQNVILFNLIQSNYKCV